MHQQPSRIATIRITDLTVRTIIGANTWERTAKQDIIINLAITFDAQKASTSDRLSDTIDYKKIKRDVIALAERSKFRLLEALTARILDEVMKVPKVVAVSVRIDKPHALRFAQSVSVEMEAQRTS